MDFFNKYILSGLLFGIIFGFIMRDVIYGIVGGILFGLSISILMKRQIKYFEKIKDEISKENKVIFDGYANHFMGKEAVGGWLYLTDKLLIFISHNNNSQNHEMVIPIAIIKKVEKYLTLGLVPNGLKIISIDAEDKFVVNDRKKWIQLLQPQFDDNINI